MMLPAIWLLLISSSLCCGDAFSATPPSPPPPPPILDAAGDDDNPVSKRSKKTIDECEIKDRREILKAAASRSLAAAAVLSVTAGVLDDGTSVALAATEPENTSTTTTATPRRKPYAIRVEYLVPAAQVHLLLQRASRAASDWASQSAADEQPEASLSLAALRNVFEKSPSRNDDNKKYGPLSVLWPRPPPASPPLVFDQLSGPMVRSALDYYTAHLRFSEDYVLTADPEQRKQLIRNDQLPDVRAVVAADLDLRDLHRNQIVQAVDDLRAELALDQPDPGEIATLLATAREAQQAWWAPIEASDVRAAQDKLRELQREKAITTTTKAAVDDLKE